MGGVRSVARGGARGDGLTVGRTNVASQVPASPAVPERDGAYGVFPSIRERCDDMKKVLAITSAVLLAASFATTAASAKKVKRGYHAYHHSHYYGGSYRYPRGPAYGSYGMMRGGTPYYPGYGASMQGNNGNSAFGNNSLGHIQGGNIGGGK